MPTMAQLKELEDWPVSVEGHTLASLRPRELDSREAAGQTVYLYYDATDSPVTRVEVYEGRNTDRPVLVVPVAPENALDAFWHPFAYAGREA